MIEAQELYFLRSKSIDTYKSIIKKRIGVIYNKSYEEKGGSVNAKKRIADLRSIYGAYTFEASCAGGAISEFLNKYVIIDSIYISVNEATGKYLFIQQKDSLSANKKVDTYICRYNIYTTATCK